MTARDLFEMFQDCERTAKDPTFGTLNSGSGTWVGGNSNQLRVWAEFERRVRAAYNKEFEQRPLHQAWYRDAPNASSIIDGFADTQERL